jgi:CBS domain containing-hemolysin-like protein
LLFLLAASFFALSETAIIALDRVRLRYLVKSGNRRAKAVEWLKDHPRHFFGIILLTTNMAVVVVAAIGSHYLFFRENILLATLIVDVIVLIFAEVTPKTLALRKPTSFSVVVGPTIRVAATMFGWLVSLMTYLPEKLFKLDLGYALSGGDIITEMQIKTMADVGEEEGAIDAGEGRMIGKVIDTGNKIVEDLMIPKVDIVYLKRDDRLRDAVKLNMEYGLSRFPVFGEDENDVLGFLHTKDIIGIFLDGNINDKVVKHLRPIAFVPESKPAIDCLYELKATRSHIAMVVDEYGQVAGFVSLEDLLEEVVGDIYDESDQVTRHITKIGADKYILNGTLPIWEAEKLLNVRITGEYETVAGLVMGLLGRIPTRDDRVQFAGWQFKVGQMDKRRIRTVFVKRLAGVSENEEEG